MKLNIEENLLRILRYFASIGFSEWNLMIFSVVIYVPFSIQIFAKEQFNTNKNLCDKIEKILPISSSEGFNCLQCIALAVRTLVGKELFPE